MKKCICFFLLFALVCSFATNASADNSTDFHGTIRKLLERALVDNSYYKIEGNDSGYYICVSQNGIMDATAAVMVGVKSHDSWQQYINVAVDYANSIQNFLEVAGVKNPNLLFVVVDDYGLNIPLLIICNGNVIYDYVTVK